MTTTKKNPSAKKIDKMIEAAYYRLANGRQIDIMKIGSLFKAAAAEITNGVDVDTAVKAAIETFCEPA